MKIAFDIGGVISKYPEQFRSFINTFIIEQHGVYVITDMHDRDEVIQILEQNRFSILRDNVYVADYKKYGEMCKAVLLKELGIDIFIDDFMGYLQWDPALGEAPIRLLVMPDANKPYWHESWKTGDASDFGRRVAPVSLIGNKNETIHP